MTKKFAATATTDELLPPLLAVVNELKSKFGKWEVPGETSTVTSGYPAILISNTRMSKPSLPVGFASQHGECCLLITAVIIPVQKKDMV